VKCIRIVVDEFLDGLRGPLTCFAAECCAFDNTRSGNGPIKMRGRVCLPEGCIDSAGGVGTMMFMAREFNSIQYCGCHSLLVTSRPYMVVWGMYNSPNAYERSKRATKIKLKFPISICVENCRSVTRSTQQGQCEFKVERQL